MRLESAFLDFFNDRAKLESAGQSAVLGIIVARCKNGVLFFETRALSPQRGLRMRIPKWSVAIGAISLAVAAAAQQPDTQYKPGPKPDPAAVARGQQIFLTNCSFCHAADATGASGPDLLRSPIALRDQHGESIGEVVRAGRPGTAMPPFPAMTDAQISDISAFLRSRIQEAANRMAYKFTGISTGDAKQGAAYFNGAGTCNTCHSPAGDFADIGNRYSEQQLLAHIAYPATPASALQGTDATSKRWQSQVTVTLPSGEKVSGELIRKGEFFLTLRDSSGWTRTFSLEDKKIIVEVNDPLAFHKAQLEKYTDADLHNLLAYLETLK
jgi:cytochrome c oxidase cbb3-type subunit 3